MKIALCHESVIPRKGGCETYIASLTRRLVEDGHEVHLYAWRWDAEALPREVHYHQIALPVRPRFLRPWLFSRGCRRELAKAGHDVSLGFDKIAGVDVYYPQGGVHTQAVSHSMEKHRSTVVRTTLRWLRWLDLAQWTFAALEQTQFRRRRSVVIAISDLVRQQLLRVQGLSAERIMSLPIATPPDRLTVDDRQGRRERFREKWNVKEDQVVSLFVGMNYRLKGLIPLLHALQQVPEMILVVAGKPRVREYEGLASRLGVQDRVRFVGYCADMRDTYFASDLLVHPTFYDPCANVVLEAMACGLPIITSRHNGACELLHSTSEPGEYAEGYVVSDPHDVNHLSARMTAMMEEGRRLKCGAAARETAAEWRFEDHYQGLLAILNEMAQSSSERFLRRSSNRRALEGASVV